MKTLSLHQPHSDLIAYGYKRLETRSWQPPIGATPVEGMGAAMQENVELLWWTPGMPQQVDTDQFGNFNSWRFLWFLEDVQRLGGSRYLPGATRGSGTGRRRRVWSSEVQHDLPSLPRGQAEG